MVLAPQDAAADLVSEAEVSVDVKDGGALDGGLDATMEASVDTWMEASVAPVMDVAMDVANDVGDIGGEPVTRDLVAFDGPGCGAFEVCGDGSDNDCDGAVDEGCVCTPGMRQRCYDGPPALAGRGACAWGSQGCAETGSWGPCVGGVRPSDEACDGDDNDCDGMTDEGLQRECYAGGAGTAGVGVCRAGTQRCVASAWGVCEGEVRPRAETCNNLDDDCNTRVDDGVFRMCYAGPTGTLGRGACRAGMELCTAGAWGRCEGEVRPRAEACGNGVDDDCDGVVDEGC